MNIVANKHDVHEIYMHLGTIIWNYFHNQNTHLESQWHMSCGKRNMRPCNNVKIYIHINTKINNVISNCRLTKQTKIHDNI